MELKEFLNSHLDEEINTSSDRAYVILISAYLEDKLSELIKIKLMDDSDTYRRLFKATGPIGSLVNKALIAYMLNS